MRQHREILRIRPERRGLTEITGPVESAVGRSGIRSGICLLFVRHTSASLLLQENAAASARDDLERFFDRLAPEGDPSCTHTAEGPDDMPAHLRSALTSTSETVPIAAGRPDLGRWQGIYLFEHRRQPGTREVVVHLIGE